MGKGQIWICVIAIGFWQVSIAGISGVTADAQAQEQVGDIAHVD